MQSAQTDAAYAIADTWMYSGHLTHAVHKPYMTANDQFRTGEMHVAYEIYFVVI